MALMVPDVCAHCRSTKNSWPSAELCGNQPVNEVDVLRRRRVIDGGADGVREAAGARGVFGHFFFLCPFPRRLASRVRRPSARPDLWLLGCAWLSVQLIQGGESRNSHRRSRSNKTTTKGPHDLCTRPQRPSGQGAS